MRANVLAFRISLALLICCIIIITIVIFFYVDEIPNFS